MRLACLGSLGLAVACTSPIAAGLEEDDANRVVLALGRASIGAEKESDPAAEGKFRVTVPRDEATGALSILRDEELPRPRHDGVLTALDKGALVPSPSVEHAQWVAGTAGDLQKSLEGIDGVLSARVHLNVPSNDGIGSLREASGEAGRPKASASVLVSYRGVTPPLVEANVQRIVAGAVPSLSPADVSVVMIARPLSPATAAANQLSHIGPFLVARGSLRPLQIGLGVLTGLVTILAFATLTFYSRWSRLRTDVGTESRDRGVG